MGIYGAERASDATGYLLGQLRPRVAGFLLGKREEERGGENIVKRILMVLTVALVMVALTVAMSAPGAFAKQHGKTGSVVHTGHGVIHPGR
jgi:hypothetical protein